MYAGQARDLVLVLTASSKDDIQLKQSSAQVASVGRVGERWRLKIVSLSAERL